MRLSMLKEEALTLYLDKKYSKDEKKVFLKKAYVFCGEYHTKIQNSITAYIEQNNLLTPFYLTVWKSMEDIGLSFNKWFPERQRKIIFEVNHPLEKEFS